MGIQPETSRTPVPGPAKEKPRPPRRPGAGHSRPEPQSHWGFPSPRPTLSLTIAPIIPPPPPLAQAQWEPGPIRAPEAPRLWRSRSRPVAAPRRAAIPLPSPGPPRHRRGPVSTGRPLFRPPHPFFRSTSRIFP